MIVSHRHAFVFLKTLKTGGTSVEMALQPFCQPDGLPITESTPELVSEAGIVGRRSSDVTRSRWYNHMTGSEVREGLGERIWQRYCKFTIVRNPWDKVVSWYHFRNKSAAELPDGELFDHFQQWLNEDPDALPVDSNLYVGEEGLMVDEVLRHEQLATQFADLTRRLKLPAMQLPRMKAGFRGRRLPYGRYYDATSRETVAQAFAYEVRHFGYAFESMS